MLPLVVVTTVEGNLGPEQGTGACSVSKFISKSIFDLAEASFLTVFIFL